MGDRRHTDSPARYRRRPRRHSGERDTSAQSRASHTTDSAHTFRLLYNQSKGLYRLYSCPVGQPTPTVPGYIEIEQYTSNDDLKTTLRHWPDLFCFIVYEDKKSGQVAFDLCNNIPDHWLDEDLFTSFVLFNSEDDATSYAAQRAEETK